MNYKFSFCVHSLFCTFVIHWPMVTHGADPSRLRHENHRKTRWCHKLLSTVDVTTCLFSWWVIFCDLLKIGEIPLCVTYQRQKPPKNGPCNIYIFRYRYMSITLDIHTVFYLYTNISLMVHHFMNFSARNYTKSAIGGQVPTLHRVGKLHHLRWRIQLSLGSVFFLNSYRTCFCFFHILPPKK